MPRYPKQRRDDDCFRAAMATLLSEPYRNLPSIRPRNELPDDNFWERWWQWFEDRGEIMVFYAGEDREPFYNTELPTLGRWIAVVPSLAMRSSVHAVVMEDERLLHDPSRNHPRTRRPRRIFYGLRVARA